jgi:phage terminase small subunit
MTPKHQKFVDNYLTCGNATKAAIAAGFKKKGARVWACRLLKKPEIKAAVEAHKEKLTAQEEIRREKILNRLNQVAFASKLKRVKTSNILKALELLGKHLGLFVDKTKTKHEGKIEIEITDYRSKK